MSANEKALITQALGEARARRPPATNGLPTATNDPIRATSHGHQRTCA
jgi:hypothetical protein